MERGTDSVSRYNRFSMVVDPASMTIIAVDGVGARVTPRMFVHVPEARRARIASRTEDSMMWTQVSTRSHCHVRRL